MIFFNKFFFKGLTFFMMAGLLIMQSCKSPVKEHVKDPNIVFILADDLGYGDVSCFNENSKINTPNIDKLASQGVMFTDAHTSSAVCTPTRYSIITGRYNWRSRLKKSVLSGYSKSLIKPDRLTIAGFLKNNGYTTGYIGKWHMGWDWAFIEDSVNGIDGLNLRPVADFSKRITNGPDTHGFDYSYGFCGSLDMAPYVWVENGMPTMVPTEKTQGKRPAFWRKGLTSDDFVHQQVLPHIKDKAVAYIKENANGKKPFFLYLPLSAPHTPIIPTKEFEGKSGLDNPYGDFVMEVDWVIGEVMKTLEKQGLSKNTIVIFTSDNGCSPEANYKQLLSQGHDPSYVFRGHKADIFEGGHRVPYIVMWAGKIKPAKSKKIICSTDFFATAADIINADIPDDVAEDSFSFLSALGLKSTAEQRKSIVHHSINGSFALRKGDWKVCFCPGSGGWSDPKPNSKAAKELPNVQLYNLSTDIGEKNNLQSEHPEIVKEFKEELMSVIDNGRSTKGVKQANDGTDNWPQLDKLKNE